MSEQAETPKVLDELSRSNNPRSGGPTERQKRNAARRVAIILVLLTPVVAALVLLGVLQWMLRADLRELRTENERLNGIIGTENSRFAQLEARLAQQSQAQANDGADVLELEALLGQEIQQLNQTIAELQSQLAARESVDTVSWRRAEAEYLLRIAGDRLQLEQDSGTARDLLVSADRILAEQADEGSQAVRQAIGRELALLEAMPRVDREAVYLRMANLMDSLDTLPLQKVDSSDFRNRLTARGSVAGEPAVTTPGLVHSALDLLGSVFVWRRWDEAPEVMLPPQQPGSAVLGMRLLLEQAQLGLIKRQETVYQASLERCRAQLGQYADMQTSQAQSFDGELQALLALNINPQVPDISQSLMLLQQLRD
ncbi:MAG: putative uroporphyrinogen methyltransferase [Pseudomonadota bacterium]